MPLNIMSGLHWCSPVARGANSRCQQLFAKSGRWGAVIILPPTGDGSISGDFKDACDLILSTVPANVGLSQCVVRLWYPNPVDNVAEFGGDGQPAAENNDQIMQFLNNNGYIAGLNYFASKGGRNVVIFNEPNVILEPQYSVHPIDLARLAYGINNAYFNGGKRLLYTLFPGPSGLQGYSGADWDYCFLGFWQRYDFLDANGKNPLTFDKAFPDHVSDPSDPLFGKTMLWHGGKGIYDRVALHCYAHNPTEFSSPTPATNPALQYIEWMSQIDPTMWMELTECGGFGGNTQASGAAFADFVKHCDPYYPQAQTVYGYILDPSNSGATSDGTNQIDDAWLDGFNAQRAKDGF